MWREPTVAPWVVKHVLSVHQALGPIPRAKDNEKVADLKSGYLETYWHLKIFPIIIPVESRNVFLANTNS